MKTRSDDLEILLAVIDCGGFSAAAEILNIQVARVSRAVSKIEQQLGATILNRTTRRVDLTEEGRLFIHSIRDALQQMNQAEEELISRYHLPKGRLSVDAASPFVLHQLVPLIQEFKVSYPEIKLELTSNEGIVDLLEKRTDIAIRVGKLTDSTLHARLLGKSKLYLVASSEYLARRGIPKNAEELIQHELIGFTDSKVLNYWPLKKERYIQPTLRASSGETIRQLALSGNGIAYLSGFMIKDDLEKGRLIPILESELKENKERERINAVYYKSSSISPRISAFVDFIESRLEL